MPFLRKLLSPIAAVYDRLTGPYLAALLFGRGVLRLRRGDPPPLAAACSILLVRLDEIGDAVMMTPLLRGLRSSAPLAKITLVVKPPVKNLFETCPYVDEVLTFDPVEMSRARRVAALFRLAAFARKELQSSPPDIALLPRWDVDYRGATILAYLSGASRVIGYSEHVTIHRSIVNLGLDGLLTDRVSSTGKNLHEVERNLSFLEAAGGKRGGDRLELWLTDHDRAAAAQLLPGGPASWIALGVSGGNNSLKAWPLERFVELARAIPDAGFVLVGSSDDRALCESAAVQIEGAGKTVVNAAGRLTLRQTAAAIEKCSAYIGCDTGPMHIASATGVPVVSLFGSSCPHRFRPWSERRALIHIDLECGPCRRIDRGVHDDRCYTCIYPEPKCMHGIDVASVLGALGQLLPDKIV